MTYLTRPRKPMMKQLFTFTFYIVSKLGLLQKSHWDTCGVATLELTICVRLFNFYLPIHMNVNTIKNIYC